MYVASSPEGNADSGTSGHYIPLSMEHIVHDVLQDTSPIRVTCANSSTMLSTKTGVLDLPLPKGARECRLFDGLKEPLISIGVLCDNGLKATFDDKKVEITDNANNIVLTGRRDHRRMYMLPITNDTQPISCSDLETPAVANASIYSLLSNARSVAQRVDFLSKTFGNPADSSLLAAAEAGHLNTVPNVSVENIRNFAPDSIESAKGHLDQSRQGIWSTKLSKRNKRKQNKSISNDGEALIVRLFDRNQLHGDLTGLYPITSHKGNNKVLVGYSEQGNFIKSVAVKGDSSEDLITGYHSLLQFVNGKLSSKGIISTVLRLDNQTSTALELYFTDVAKIPFKFVPPGNHRTLHVERDIRTWKNQFISTRAGADPKFKDYLWDELLPHVDMTLNILRPCLAVPNTSAWDYMCGPWDYKSQPLGPAGAKVLVYENPQQRASFADHGVEAFYLGTAPNHYRCHRVWVPSTRDYRVSDTLSWHLHDPFGFLSNHTADDSINNAIDSLVTATINTTSAVDTSYLQQAVTQLKNLQETNMTHNNKTNDIESVTRVFEPDQQVPLPPILSPNIPTTVQVATTSAESIPRVAIVPNSSLKVPAVPKTSRNLRSNKNHVFTDPHPVVHDALKIIRLKGSNATPLNPLRFRVRWKGSSPKHDTWEPLSHVQSCQPFLDFVQAQPKLWYLLEGRDELQPHSVLQTPKTTQKPISVVHAHVLAAALEEALAVPTIDTYGDAAYAKAITPCLTFTDPPLGPDNLTQSLNKFEMYDLLHMNYTPDMNNDMWVACAAGDMDGDGDELKLRKCLVGPDKDHWIQADITEYHKLLRQHEVMHPIKLADIPAHKKPYITYYNAKQKSKRMA